MPPAQQYRLVSADSHLSLPPGFFATYMPAELQDHPWVRTIERMDKAALKRAGMGLAHMAGRRFEDFKSDGLTEEEIRPGAYEPAARLSDMDLDDVDAEVLISGGQAPTGPGIDEAFQRAVMQAYNNFLSEFCAHDPRRLIGPAPIPLQNLALAAEEMRRAADLPGIRGYLLDAFPVTPLWDDAYEPLWHIAAERDLPVMFHVRSRPTGTFAGVDPGVPDPRGVPLAMISLVNTSLLETLAILVLTGVLERHPALRVVFTETAVSWLPYFEERLDTIVERHRHWSGCRLPERPSHYVGRQCLFTFIEDKVGVRIRHEVGVDRMMWSNDYPHSDSTWPDSAKAIAEAFDGVDAGERHRILAGNAVDLFGLDAG
jgi:predicted TIM-barrel fold metal-dependent hydrolase